MIIWCVEFVRLLEVRCLLVIVVSSVVLFMSALLGILRLRPVVILAARLFIVF